jgi:IS30 family transposase
VTVDNGKEFAEHALWDETLNANVYFARPYHAWERGLNKNTKHQWIGETVFSKGDALS